MYTLYLPIFVEAMYGVKRHLIESNCTILTANNLHVHCTCITIHVHTCIVGNNNYYYESKFISGLGILNVSAY